MLVVKKAASLRIVGYLAFAYLTDSAIQQLLKSEPCNIFIVQHFEGQLVMAFLSQTYVCCCSQEYVRAGHLQGQLTTKFFSCLPDSIPKCACQHLLVVPAL